MSTRETDPSSAERQGQYHLKRDGLAMAGGFLLGLSGLAIESGATFTAGMVVMMGASLSIIIDNARNDN